MGDTKDFLVQVIFRAQDQLSQVLAAISGQAKSTGAALGPQTFATSSRTLDDLAQRANRLGAALGQGNFIGAAREAGALTEALKVTSGAATGATGAAEGAAAGFAGVGAGAVLAIAGVAALGIAIAVTTQKLLEAADEGARYADSIEDLATRTGISVEALSRLSFAAQQSDTDVQTLALGIKFLSKNLFEAQKGSGDAHDALVALGFSADQIARGFGSTEQALETMADRFASVENPATRTALALQIFGRSGERMIPFLLRGADGIRELEAEADRLGITVSELAGRIGDDYTHSLERLQGAQLGLKVQLSTVITPAITDFINLLTELVATLNKVSQSSAGKFAFTGLVEGIKSALAIIVPFGLQIQAIAAAIDRVRGATGANSQAHPASPATAEHATLSDAEIAKNTAAAAARKKDLEDAQKAKEAAIAAAKSAAEALAKVRVELQAVIQQSFAVPEAVSSALARIDPSAAIAQIKKIEDALEKVVGDTKALKPIVPEGLDAKTQGEQAFKDLTFLPPSALEPLEQLGPMLDAIGPHAQELQKVFEQIGVSITALNAELELAGTTLQSLSGTTILIGEVLDSSLNAAFDPILGAISDTQNAVGNLKATFDGAFSTLAERITNGQISMLKFSDAVLGAVRAVSKLIIELVLAIAKAAILKVIGFGLFSGGGVVGDVFGGGPNQASSGAVMGRGRAIQHFAQGGTVAPIIARFAEGGTMPAVLRQRIQHFAEGGIVRAQKVIHAASGFTVPGAASRVDTYPALLTAGETVLPVSPSGSKPMDVIQSFESKTVELVNLFAQVSRGTMERGRGDTNVVVNTISADGFRSFFRGGDFAEESGLAYDGARG